MDYKLAIKSISNPNAISALKNYHVAYLRGIDGVEPINDESTFEYNKRQNIADEKMNEAWTRFELEQ
jgi:hypothetical protein